MRVQVFGRYTYTMETIVQAGWNGIAVESVPIRLTSVLFRHDVNVSSVDLAVQRYGFSSNRTGILRGVRPRYAS